MVSTGDFGSPSVGSNPTTTTTFFRSKTINVFNEFVVVF